MTQEKFKEIIAYIAECIKGSEFENHVFAVGGCVRDTYMGNEIKDIDLCIDLPDGGMKLAEFLHKEKVLTRPPVVYPTYGTAMFKFKKFNQDEIECVHTRGEQYHDKNSRNPETCFASIEEDCIRRDLTMNALYMNVTTGEILDLTGKGMDDIKNKICRVTNENPDIVFDDDSLRILRVIRFATKYNFWIEDETMKSMIKNVDRLSIITQERITDEFNKMMMTDDPSRALCLLGYTGAMKYVVPEFIETYNMGQNAYHFGTVWDHTIGVVENNAKACRKGELKAYLPVRLACAFHDLGKIKTRTVGEDGRVHFYDHETVGADLVREIMTKMRYPNDVIDETCFYIRNHMLTKSWGDDLSHMKIKTLRKLMYKCKTEERFMRLMEVIDADNNAHKKEHCMPNQTKNIASMVINEINHNTSMFGYQLPIDGNEVMEVLGIEPGPKVKKYLDHCMKLAFNNPNITKEQCIKEIKHFKLNE
jgi:putative nucleotidyltransferase with HDIG domain